MSIRRDQRRRIASAAIVLAVLSLTGSLCFRRESLQAVVVETACVEQEDIIGNVICYGELEYGTRYALYADQTLRLDSWLVEQGTQVSEGQALLVGQTVDYVSLQDSLLGLLDSENILAVFSSVTGQDTGVQTAERCSAQIRKKKGSCELLSPVDGIVTGITPLSAAQAETTLVVVADPESLQVSAQLPEAYVQDVAVGLPCIITGNAFRDHSYTGVITEIAPFAYTEFSLSGDGQRVVDLTIRVDDPDEALYAGYSAEARIQNYMVEDALFIPFSAVMQDENCIEYVYVIHMGRAFRRNISTGQEIDGSVEVKEGLAAGEHVICNPQADFYDGMPVRQER